MADSRYCMTISLNVLNHLGLNLYSHRPAVLAEVIANAWDADASEVQVDFDLNRKTITISDNGCGMDLDDVNKKYLFVGYQKREHQPLTERGRKPMGRKGIGKLSLFSIANKIYVYTQKEGKKREAFLMDSDKIRRAIMDENPASSRVYRPEVVGFTQGFSGHGTMIKITDLKTSALTQTGVESLRRRIARRFGTLSGDGCFRICVDGKEVTYSDRDYFHKARFLFQYGGHDYAQYCKNLDTDDGVEELPRFQRPSSFGPDGTPAESGEFRISGWIAIARQSSDLDGQGDDENLNKITIMVRKKVAQEDILQEYRLGGLITKYIFGEIHADYLDDDDKEDIATSGRQRISEDNARYRALKAFIDFELRYIWNETNKLKNRSGLNTAIKANPHIKRWYDGLVSSNVRTLAAKFFGAIEEATIDENRRHEFYASAVLAIQTFRAKETLGELEGIDASNVEVFLSYLTDLDAIEAEKYRQIIQDRLEIIKKLEASVKDNAQESVLRDYLFDRLWLLDPAWERATQYKAMEKTVQTVVQGMAVKGRIDIRYKRVMAGHVIVELKRANVRVTKVRLEEQVRKYIRAVRKELRNMGEPEEPLEAVCIVGELPKEWQDSREREEDRRSLSSLSIRIITYDELIKNARSAYSKFVGVSEDAEDLKTLFDNIRSHQGP